MAEGRPRPRLDTVVPEGRDNPIFMSGQGTLRLFQPPEACESEPPPGKRNPPSRPVLLMRESEEMKLPSPTGVTTYPQAHSSIPNANAIVHIDRKPWKLCPRLTQRYPTATLQQPRYDLLTSGRPLPSNKPTIPAKQHDPPTLTLPAPPLTYTVRCLVESDVFGTLEASAGLTFCNRFCASPGKQENIAKIADWLSPHSKNRSLGSVWWKRRRKKLIDSNFKSNNECKWNCKITQGNTRPPRLSCGHILVPGGYQPRQCLVIYTTSILFAANALNEVRQCAGRRHCNPE